MRSFGQWQVRACVAAAVVLAGRTAAAECDSDSDCDAGGRCQGGECVALVEKTQSAEPSPAPPTPACTRQADCIAGRECIQGACVEPLGGRPNDGVRPPGASRPRRAPAGNTEDAKHAPVPRGNVTLIPYFGLVVSGSTVTTACGEWYQPGCHDLEHSNDLKFRFGADVLYRLGSELRVGVGIAHSPKGELEIVSANRRIKASTTTFPAVLEPVLPLSRFVGLVLRGELGPVLLSPTERIEDEYVVGPPPTIFSTSDKGPWWGWSVGGGVGLVGLRGKGRPRVDLRYVRWSAGEVKVKATDGRETSSAYSGSHLAWVLGVEFF